MKVENFKHINQYLITVGNIITFQSYNSTIASYNRLTGNLKVFKDWDYSNTTRKHFKMFINELTIFNYETKKQWIKEMNENNKIEVV